MVASVVHRGSRDCGAADRASDRDSSALRIESLTSPLNLAAVLPAMDDGIQPRPTRSLDIFVLWWCGLLAIGLAT